MTSCMLRSSTRAAGCGLPVAHSYSWPQLVAAFHVPGLSPIFTRGLDAQLKFAPWGSASLPSDMSFCSSWASGLSGVVVVVVVVELEPLPVWPVFHGG